MDSKTIKELFGTLDRNFKIPSYQRAYSWGKENVEQFMKDLKEETDKYYLGNFIFENDSKDKNTYYIIDGQQRLTTCIIFFSVLKEYLEEKKSKILNIEDITAKYLYGISGSKKDEPRFETVEYDNDFFRKEILGLPVKNDNPEFGTSSQKRIKEAKRIIKSEIKNSETEIIGWVKKWVEKIENAKITCYVENDKVHSTQIFSFQNDRGKKLTTLEILKAYFMLQVYLSSKNEDDIIEIETKFKLIYFSIEKISNMNEDNILNYWWRSESEKGLISSNTIEEIKEKISEISDKFEKANTIKKYAKELAKAFSTVQKIQGRKDKDAINLLRLDNMSLSYPFLIKIDRITDNVKYLDTYIKILENITLRDIVIMSRYQVDKRLNWYLPSLSIENISEYAFAIINNIQENGYWGYWNDDCVKGAISNGYFAYNPACKYILYEYDLSIGNDQASKKPYKELQIEHIAPCTPEDGSKIANGYGKYYGDNAIEEGEWLNSIGNFMIIYGPNNASIGNKDFITKFSSYDKKQQDDIESCLESKSKRLWDSHAIEQRSGKMLDAVMKIWDLNKVSDFINEKLNN